MKGYVTVSINDLKRVLHHHDDFFEEYNIIIKKIKKAAYDKYTARLAGTRTFWHWLYLVPWSEADARCVAIDELTSSWYGGTRFHMQELEFTDNQCNMVQRLERIISFGHSEIQQVRACLARTSIDTVLLDIDTTNTVHNVIKAIETLDLRELQEFLILE